MAYSSDEDDGAYCYSCERSFVSQQALHSHVSHSSRHHYCHDCDRDFANDNALRQHRASKRHQDPLIFCSRCSRGFVSAAALTKHIEVGGCYNLTNRQIVQCVRDWEERSGLPHCLTIPRIGWRNGYEDTYSADSRVYATEASYDGQCYVCAICDRGFWKLWSLNQHLNSSVHEASEFRCKKCGKHFRELSALVGHVESETCGAMSSQGIRNIMRNLGSMSLTNC